jgi:hypothetical protein
MEVKIAWCQKAQQDHNRSKRQYAHVLHKDGVICVCKEFWELPNSHYYGVLAHEVGHLLSDAADEESDEEQADHHAEQFFGVELHYRSGKWGRKLQYLKEWDVTKVKDDLGF